MAAKGFLSVRLVCAAALGATLVAALGGCSDSAQSATSGATGVASASGTASSPANEADVAPNGAAGAASDPGTAAAAAATVVAAATAGAAVTIATGAAAPTGTSVTTLGGAPATATATSATSATGATGATAAAVGAGAVSGLSDVAPVITGTPASTIAAGTPYAFQPTLSAAAGAKVAFSIANKPRWAIFNTATGALTGTPGTADIGTDALVAISVSSGLASSALPAFAITVTPAVSSVTLSWSAPTQNTNGTSLMDLAGYHVYYGTSPAAMTTVATVAGAASTRQVIGNLTNGTWYFTVAAYNSQKVESTPSAQLTVDVANAAAVSADGGSAAVAVNFAATANVAALVSNGATVEEGGLDGAGDAYAATLLGGSLSWSGATFVFLPPGAADAVSGTTIALPAGNYSSVELLGTAVNGNQAAQSFVVTYADGSSTTVKQSLSDWSTPASYPGETIAKTMSYRIADAGTMVDGNFNLYGYSLPINAAKTVASLTLPANRNVIVLAAAVAP